MPTDMAAAVRLKYDSGAPTDVAVNVHHYSAVPYTVSQAADVIHPQLKLAYDFPFAWPNQIMVGEVNYYEVGVPGSGEVRPLALVASGAPSASEVAAVISWNTGGLLNKVGRSFIGPLPGNELNAKHIPTTLLDALEAMANAIRGTAAVDPDVIHVIRSALGVQLPSTGWAIDNSWDTMRSRGIARTATRTSGI